MRFLAALLGIVTPSIRACLSSAAATAGQSRFAIPRLQRRVRCALDLPLDGLALPASATSSFRNVLGSVTRSRSGCHAPAAGA